MPEQQSRPDVELDRVGACLDRRGERLDRVLGRERRGAAVPDHERAAFAPADDHAGPLPVGRHRRDIAARRRAQIPNVVWISRQAVSEKTTVRKMSTASTTQKRAFELRVALLALAAARGGAPARGGTRARPPRDRATGHRRRAPRGRVAGWAIGGSLERFAGPGHPARSHGREQTFARG